MRIWKILAFVVAMTGIGAATSSQANAQSVVSYKGITRGTIVINTQERKLYLGLGGDKAKAYPVGVGKRGMQWKGQKYIRMKRIKPAWQPTNLILRETGGSLKTIPGGSSSNPMGAAALVLSGGGQYAIHGTNNPNSIGGFVSHGCIRMHNRDIMDLYKRVWIGTKVIVK